MKKTVRDEYDRTKLPSANGPYIMIKKEGNIIRELNKLNGRYQRKGTEEN